jgi:HPt (histidine-containing phosphotransfer) domain-containing protein
MADVPPESRAILNLPALVRLTGGDVALLRELARLYVADGDRKLPTLEEAAAARDLVRVGHVAHGLKGSSLSVGAEQAADAFRRLEALGRSGEAEGLPDAVAEVRRIYARTRDRLRELAA